jgi:hypothetical protein
MSVRMKMERCRTRCVSEHPSFLGKVAIPAAPAPLHPAAVAGEAPALALQEAALAEDDKALRIQPLAAVRRVSFTSLEIREYAVVPGDHPLCSSGCPIALGWTYTTKGNSSEPLLSVEAYEAKRCPRRFGDRLRLSVEEREDLLAASNCPLGEVRRAARRHHRTKSCEGRYCTRNLRTFFHTTADA